MDAMPLPSIRVAEQTRLMRIEHQVVSLSWIPSEAIGGVMKLPFEAGITHYDDPPPERIDDLEALRAADRFRFANLLRAWIEVDSSGAIKKAGHMGGVLMGSTTVRAGRRASRTFEAFAMPVLQEEPEISEDRVRFVQTIGGRTGVPAPRRVNRPPFVQWNTPLVWTTLALTIHADGRAEHEVVSATRSPGTGSTAPTGSSREKSGLTDFKDWYRHAFGKHSPWGDESSPALVTAAETALERQLSLEIMRGGEKPEVRKINPGLIRIMRGETLALRKADFVPAAIARAPATRRSSSGTSCPT